MQDYIVITAAGIITKDEQPHAEGDTVSLDPADQLTVDLLGANAIKVAEAAPAETAPAEDTAAPADVTIAPFNIEVTFVDGASQEDKDAAAPFIADLSTQANSDAAAVPAVITAITVRRN